MSSKHTWNLVARNNFQPRAGGKNWTVRYKCRDKKEEIWLDWTHSTKKWKWNLPQRCRMEPTGKEIKRMPQSHLEAHCLERMWEKVYWRTTSSSQQPCTMEALCGRPMFLTESGGYVCICMYFVKTPYSHTLAKIFIISCLPPILYR